MLFLGLVFQLALDVFAATRQDDAPRISSHSGVLLIGGSTSILNDGGGARVTQGAIVVRFGDDTEQSGNGVVMPQDWPR